MNSALLLSNVVALAVLVSFHFAQDKATDPVAQHMPHYLQVQKAPQLAVMNDQRGFVGQEVSQRSPLPVAPSSDRLVF